MTFGEALEALKAGRRVERHGWIGLRMFVVLEQPSIRRQFDGDHGTMLVAPYLAKKDARGVLRPGWVPSQEEMLAEDWRAL